MSVNELCIAAKGRRADVAVVGAGPVGMKLALDLADAGIDVMLVESGREGTDKPAQALGDAEIVDPARHAPMDLAVRRGLGGTSALWGGRAGAFDRLARNQPLRISFASSAAGSGCSTIATPAFASGH